ncbi:MAG: DEAD/DEAH box helicase [Thermofilaceae archaeon]
MSLVEKTEKALKMLKGESARLNDFQLSTVNLIERTDGNVLVIGPTGVGKTMVGVAALIKYGKGFYLAPLRSLMYEKYVELRKMFPGKSVVLTNKDYSVTRSQLKNADIRVLSPYKFMLYLDYIDPSDGVVVIDEIHKVHEDPDIEAAVTTMKVMGFRVVGLSATIHEEDEPKFSRWLDATVVRYEGSRPVPLRFVEVKLDLEPGGVSVVDGAGFLDNDTRYPSKEAAVADLVKKIMESDPSGGVMVWCPTRSESDNYALLIARRLTTKLVGVAKDVLTTTEHDRVLKTVIEKGVALHHGGVSPRNRELVEELFRKKRCNVVVSCYTLSHGVNLPVRYLVITTLYNHEGKLLDPSTFHQLSGRAGRPGLDDFGVVITVTVGELESFVLSKILSESSTRVHSRLHNKWTLTKLLAQRLAVDRNIDVVKEFLKETYYVYEHGLQGYEEIKKLGEECLTNVVDAYFDLRSSGMVVPKGREEFAAAIMGLHPDEWRLRTSMVAGDYRSTVEEAVDVASRARGIDDRAVKKHVVDFGLLSHYMGSWKVRELADATQSMLDAVALYVRRVYGWKSQEFSNAKRIVDLFVYGGNPRAEELAKVLRYDEMKRVIRNLPNILFAENPSIDDMATYVKEVVNLVFGVRKVISAERVGKVVKAVLGVMYEEVDDELLSEAMDVAMEEVRSISKELGAKIR